MGKAHFSFSLFIVAFAIVNVCKADEEIGIYELQRGNLSVNITNYGATVLNVVVPDKYGKLDDIVLGYGSIDDYKNDTTYFGALVGRVANRIGGAKFTLNGKVYKLPANDHGNTLHGGTKGYSNVIWRVREHVKDSHLTLTYDSYDGEQGFPGDLSVSVTYLLLGQNKFAIRMQAKPTTKPTPVNLVSHTYWNLGGHASGNILNTHTIQLFASQITPANKKLIPTGKISNVKGTPYDFLEPRVIGTKMPAGGYDINYILDKTGTEKHLTKVSTVWNGKTGRKLELWSDQVGVQFYTSNMLKDTVGKGGVLYRQYGALCLETQGYPDSVNHPNFPSQIVNPGESYRHVMVHRFTAS
ncbi:hypothetical protein CASFOL_015570 [Castilleja foliolosa]|uniref:Aldose 1-epimerase n=1 Tax=Castilleja foliolosa TaxID=1961234 RepID=A0ABD3DEZ7_9LAMI